jgi:hypothetical protein
MHGVLFLAWLRAILALVVALDTGGGETNPVLVSDPHLSGDGGAGCDDPAAIAGDGACRTYAPCCGISTEEATMACSYSRSNNYAACSCATGDHGVKCEDSGHGVACRCE